VLGQSHRTLPLRKLPPSTGVLSLYFITLNIDTTSVAPLPVLSVECNKAHAGKPLTISKLRPMPRCKRQCTHAVRARSRSCIVPLWAAGQRARLGAPWLVSQGCRKLHGTRTRQVCAAKQGAGVQDPRRRRSSGRQAPPKLSSLDKNKGPQAQQAPPSASLTAAHVTAPPHPSPRPSSHTLSRTAAHRRRRRPGPRRRPPRSPPSPPPPLPPPPRPPPHPRAHL
jgi:hypothetical protein